VPPELNTPHVGTAYLIEGIGYDVVPAVLSREPGLIDSWIKIGDAEAFAALRLLLRKEGLLVGGSSGTVLAGARAWFETEEGARVASEEGRNVVLLLPGGCVLALHL
jgi:cystathionine beta-synthase